MEHWYLLRVQLLPFITPWERLITDRIKVVPAEKTQIDLNIILYLLTGCKWILNFKSKRTYLKIFLKPRRTKCSILLNKLSLLLFFSTCKKLINFMWCWDMPLRCILCSAVSLSWASGPGSGTRGSYVIWVPNQTARCGFSSAPVTIEINFIKYNINKELPETYTCC